MSWVLAVLLLAISKTAVGQCEYVYIAEPPSGQLICDPFQINRLQLVCSIFVADISQSDFLRIQWFFSAPVNRQFNPANAVLLEEASFVAVPRETFTTRILVSTPPIGFYFCQPLLTSGRQLLRSNVVPLQPPNVFLQRNIRPCLINEFQNSSIPFCAIPGVTIDPNQIIAPAPTIIGTLQYITPTVLNSMTPTALLVVAQTPVAQQTPIAVASNDVTQDSINAGLIAGVVISIIVAITIAIIVIVGTVVLCKIRKKRIDSKFPKTYNSRRISDGERYATPATPATVTITEQDGELQEETLLPPNKPPPTLKSPTNKHIHVTNHRYNRLIRFPKAGKSSSRMKSTSESSAYYITPEHDSDDGVEYYVEFDEDHIEKPYVDASESLVYTDSHYGAESDFYLQQQRNQQKFIRSSSLELQSDEEGTHTRKVATTINATNQMVHSQHKYQNCALKSKHDIESTSLKANIDTDSTPYYQEIIATRELETEYTNVEMLESTAF